VVRVIGTGAILPIARYRFEVRMEGELRLPEYAGSLLRGQFGAALRHTACMTGESRCDGCALRRTCPFPMIFDAPAPPEHALQKFSQVPNSYVIEPPPFGTRSVAAGNVLGFHMVLVGRSIAQLPLIAHAWGRAFVQGIGRDRVRGTVENIAIVDAPPALQSPGESEPGLTSVWDAEAKRILHHEASIRVPEFPALDAVSLSVRTPLRLQSQGRPLEAAELTPRVLLGQLLRRASLILEFHADLPPSGEEAALVRSSEGLLQSKDLRWRDWTRYSTRQQQQMHFGGVVGSWSLAGQPLQRLLPWLWIGQLLHAGKNATFGMGAYDLRTAAGNYRPD
jgi:hypothetical protein